MRGEDAKPSEDEVTSGGTQETANLVSVDGTAVLHWTGPETIPWTGDVYVPLWRQDCFMGPENAHLEQAICNQGLLLKVFTGPSHASAPSDSHIHQILISVHSDSSQAFF